MFNNTNVTYLSSFLDKDPSTFLHDPSKVTSIKKRLGYSDSNAKRSTVNRYFVALEVKRLVHLLTLKEDRERMLVYNRADGVWVDAIPVLSRLILEVIHAIPEAKDNDIWSKQLEQSVIDILLRKVRIETIDRFNKDHFAFSNLTYDFSKQVALTHQPTFLTTYSSPVTYDEASACPKFMSMLDTLFHEQDTKDFVQEWFGYCLSTSHKANAFVIGVGKGSNGKSTLFDVLAKIVGMHNVSSAPLSNLNTTFGLEPILGKKLNIATESSTESFTTAKLKAITAGEAVTVNRKNKPEITTVIDAKLVFLVNELPLLSDTSHGLVRRLIILPFNQTIPAEKQDKGLSKALEQELSGILNWSLSGFERLVRNNYTFTESSEMLSAKNRYIENANPVESFIEAHIIQDIGNRLDSSKVLTKYVNWMYTQGLPLKGTSSPQIFWMKFKESMDTVGIHFTKSKSNGQSVVRDIGFK